MAIDGRINVDVLFHDTDGTTSLKVVSLEDSTAYTTGKVAIVSGTVGTTAVALWNSGGTGLANQYKASNGELVGAIDPTRIAVRSHSGQVLVSDADLGEWELLSRGGLSVSDNRSAAGTVRSISGTASYTVVLYGT